jgi:tripartite-type tricarboxylate transporter receptor subunit TctC
MENRTFAAICIAGGVTALAAAFSNGALADPNFPSRVITIVVPFPAGGTADLLPRLAAEQLRPMLGQPVVIENKPGASGNIGTEGVARSAPDGYTLINAPQLSFSVNHLLNPKLRFDPRALEPVSVLATYPTVLFARGDLPANSLPELISYAKANPGKINYASQGLGQIGHLTLEALKLRAGIDMVHVPYRGSAPAINDLLAGQVDILADNLLSGMQHVQSGKLKIIAVGSKDRIKPFPNAATFAETLPGFYSDTWMAIAAPAGTPKEVTAKLSASIAKALQSADLRRRIEDLQAEPFGSTPEQMAELIKESHDRWAPVIEKAKITVE